MSEILELRKELARYTDEVRRLRGGGGRPDQATREKLRRLGDQRRAAAERVAALQQQQRAVHEERKAARESRRAYSTYHRAVAEGEREADPALAERLRAAVCDHADTNFADPMLGEWYHTIELGAGLVSEGRFDLRPTADHHGIPASLGGKTALDVGTCDGFWAFELERRGADGVVAVDVDHWGDIDWLPRVADAIGSDGETRMDTRFWLAHALRGSRVVRRTCSVYELSPELAGTFDVVFCGSLVMHLHNPLRALVNIRSVTGEMAIVATLLSEELERLAPDEPAMTFGHRWPDLESEAKPQLGAAGVYWHVNTRGLRELMEYAGFARTEALAPVRLTPTDSVCAVVLGYPS